MAEAIFDHGTQLAEIEDDTGENMQYWRADRGRYTAQVAPGVIFPTEDVKIWRDYENRVFLIYNPVPKFKEVFEGKKSLEGLPADAKGIAARCRIIGIVKTENRLGTKVHTVHPHPQDPKVISAYVAHTIFYFNLDSRCVPFMKALREAQG
ncbi:MAG: hypothetical protein KAT43_03440 [Nanoarchaeota archaeon]|nr:hypothetical protein [Nanoarchaeota archaeon]